MTGRMVLVGPMKWVWRKDEPVLDESPESVKCPSSTGPFGKTYVHESGLSPFETVEIPVLEGTEVADSVIDRLKADRRVVDAMDKIGSPPGVPMSGWTPMKVCDLPTDGDRRLDGNHETIPPDIFAVDPVQAIFDEVLETKPARWYQEMAETWVKENEFTVGSVKVDRLARLLGTLGGEV